MRASNIRNCAGALFGMVSLLTTGFHVAPTGGDITPIGTLLMTESDPGASGAGFGYAVAISGNTAVLGSLNSVYIYVKNGAHWPAEPTATLADPSDADGTAFGSSVAISGPTLVVGAFAANNIRGAAYIYVKDGSSWPMTPSATLEDPDSNVNSQDQFGSSVATFGSTIAVGALGTAGFDGATYLFVKNRTGWPTVPTTTLIDPSTDVDQFGVSVSLSSHTLCVGADGAGGAAYLYSETLSGWSSSPSVSLPDPNDAASDFFGVSVSLSTSTLVVGSNGAESGAGAAYVYVKSSSGWPTSPSATLVDPGGSASDHFGFSSATSGTALVVGAFNRTSDLGAAYVYLKSGSRWPTAPSATFTDPVTGNDAFGEAIAISGGAAVVGAWKADSGSGAGYVYKA
jgi:FG-GAP repeat